MSGYRNAGERAIRVDMLERLADMLRSQDSKSGFECNSDMLSITGMTLEQFAALMIGLGYKTVKGTRLKEVSEKENETEINQELGKEDTDDSEKDPVELHEVFYKFFWVPKKVNKGKNYSQKDLKLNKKKGKPSSAAGSKNVRSPHKNIRNHDKPIDPDNPFAKALMGFKQDN
jgi:ATP-dependent RNA helicase SUPV3L1/SUV3